MATANDVITEGRRYLGVPYVTGAPYPCSASGMDCDCLTKTTFNGVGVALGWWTDQLNYGIPIAVANRQPGDLLFFSEDGSGLLTHVGILSYNGYLLHASSYFGKVVESDMRLSILGPPYAVRRLTDSAPYFPPYSRVVDNSDTARFYKYAGWELASASGQYGTNHARALPGSGNAAWYKFDVPRTADYIVYVWHPASSGFNQAMPVGIHSPSNPYADGSGMVWRYVDLRSGGGQWLTLGRYTLPVGDDWTVCSSRYSNYPGYVLADAVKIVSA